MYDRYRLVFAVRSEVVWDIGADTDTAESL